MRMNDSQASKPNIRVAVVTPNPTPYRDPFWNAVAQLDEVDLTAFYCGGTTKDRPWDVSWPFEFKAEVMPGTNVDAWRGPEGSRYWNPGMKRRLDDGRFDAVICGGYNHLTMLYTYYYAIRHRIPYFMMSEVYLAQPRAWWAKLIKAIPVRFLHTHAAGCFPTGTLASEYMAHYGAPVHCLSHVPNTPDVEAYWTQAQDLAPRREDLRKQEGLDPDIPMIIFVGRLIPLKEVDTLIDAFKIVRDTRPAKLMILGDGTERSKLEQQVRTLGLTEDVIFSGFLEPEQIPAKYAMADLFVLTSNDETWSAVVLEALASGLPVIVTEMVGCYPDIVKPASVGSVVPVHNKDKLAEAIIHHLNTPKSREDIAEAWAPVRETLRYPVIAQRMLRVLQQGIAESKEKHGAPRHG
jgi:glycosyltransferase involved in cell wall biosynthesis